AALFASISPPKAPEVSKTVSWQEEGWRLSHRWIQQAAENQSQPKPSPPGQVNESPKYDALAITVGVSLEPLEGTLRKLAAVLVGVSFGIWLMALILSGAVCKRALGPVRKMAISARKMDAADLGQRLAVDSTGDELEELARAFNDLLDR